MNSTARDCEAIKISVIVPVYNMGDSIVDCVNSVLRQNHRNIELILVNDGSTDNSAEVCDLLARADKRVKAVHSENMGSGPARNLGMDFASGDFFVFPDADDVVTQTGLTAMLATMLKNQADLVIGGYTLKFPDGHEDKRVYLPKTFCEMDFKKKYEKFSGAGSAFSINGAPWNKLFRASLVRKSCLTFPNFRRHQDKSFLLKYLDASKKIAFAEDVTYVHYVNSLANEWDKFPSNYIASVIGLRGVQEKTVVSWNPDNLESIRIIDREYQASIVKAMELSCSPRLCLDDRQRSCFINDVLIEVKKAGYDYLGNRKGYHGVVMRLVDKQYTGIAKMLILLKVQIEKSGILLKIKR